MKLFLKFLKENIGAIGVIVLNAVYFLPKTINWLFWNYSGSEGYGGLIVAFYYIAHLFFILSCLSLVQKTHKKYRLSLLLFLALIAIISMVFSFRDIPILLCIFLLWYLFVFFKSYKRIESKNANVPFIKRLTLFGFFLLMAWVILDKIYVLH